jgi:hypothetical protein
MALIDVILSQSVRINGDLLPAGVVIQVPDSFPFLNISQVLVATPVLDLNPGQPGGEVDLHGTTTPVLLTPENH